jgi:uncharacterized Zn finger protein
VQFTDDELLARAGEAVFARGEGYVRYVHGLVVSDGSARASIQAKRVYQVELSWANGVAGSCTCPHYADGNFCKHLVAVGLAVLDGVPPPPSSSEEAALAAYVDELDRDALAELVLDLAREHEPARRVLQVRAVRAGQAVVDPAELVSRVNDTLSVGFVDYRRSFDVAAVAQDMLDDLQDLLDAGVAEAVRPALQRATMRLRKVGEQADDSAGVLGDAGQRAADLHARACREGSPDPVKLAKWLLKFRLESPGWPHTPLADYVEALDLDVYRRGVARASDGPEVEQMRLELLDNDSDVSGAIAFLSSGQHVQFGAIIDRLRDRPVEALEWLDRAVAAGRVWHADDEYHRSYDTAVRMYQDAGRLDDALAIRRDAFARQAGAPTFRALLDAARLVGREDADRKWALAEAERLAADQFGTGRALIEIALHEGDLHRAVRAAQRYGAAGAWQPLAEACAPVMPAAAAELYQAQIAELLQQADSRNYQLAVGHLLKVRELFATMDQRPAFDVYLDRIREEHKRRPTFMAELERRLR